MKITAIKTAVVEVNFDWTFVRVYTDRGLYDTGDGFFAPGLSGAITDIAEVILREDPRNIDYLRRDSVSNLAYPRGPRSSGPDDRYRD